MWLSISSSCVSSITMMRRAWSYVIKHNSKNGSKLTLWYYTRKQYVGMSKSACLLVLRSCFKHLAQPAGLVALFPPLVVLLEITAGVYQVAASPAHTVHVVIASGVIILWNTNVLSHTDATWYKMEKKIHQVIKSCVCLCIKYSEMCDCVFGSVLNIQSSFYFYSSVSHCSECPYLSYPEAWFSSEKVLKTSPWREQNVNPIDFIYSTAKLLNTLVDKTNW